MSSAPPLSFTDQISNNEWNTFVKNHPNGNIFHLPEFAKVYEQTASYQPVCLFAKNTNTNSIEAAVVGVIQKEGKGLLGKLSSRLIIWGGPLVINNNKLVLDSLLEELIKQTKSKAIYIQIRNLWAWEKNDVDIFKKHGFNSEDHLDILHNLTIGAKAIFDGFYTGRRKNIRRAEKLGLVFDEVKSKEEYLVCLNIIKDTYKKIRLPFPKDDFFTTAFDNLGKQQLLRTFVLRNKTNIISTRMVLCFNGMIYDWYAGTKDDGLELYPNDYLPWKILEWGCENNFHVFDFGGAGSPHKPYGVRDYKLKFGGQLVQFNRFQRVNNKLLLHIATAGFKVWKKLKAKR